MDIVAVVFCMDDHWFFHWSMFKLSYPNKNNVTVQKQITYIYTYTFICIYTYTCVFKLRYPKIQQLDYRSKWMCVYELHFMLNYFTLIQIWGITLFQLFCFHCDLTTKWYTVTITKHGSYSSKWHAYPGPANWRPQHEGNTYASPSIFNIANIVILKKLCPFWFHHYGTLCNNFVQQENQLSKERYCEFRFGIRYALPVAWRNAIFKSAITRLLHVNHIITNSLG